MKLILGIYIYPEHLVNYSTEAFNSLGPLNQSFVIFQQIFFTIKAYSKCNHER